ncbi:MAG TPA: hypothetical protein VFU51_00840 [Gaiellaceae bacterium]|jgi:hypothetical protein|nr:hypothetical protein [Gaiellaceae bacterium]
MASGRDEIEAEINAHVGSWLDTVPEGWGDDFKIGTFALIFEVEFPPDEDSAAGATNVGWTCSDHRNWVQAGLFRRALIESEAHIGRSTPDDE